MTEKTVTIVTLVILGIIVIAGGGAVYYLNFVVTGDKKREIAQTDVQIRSGLAKKRMLETDPKREKKSLMDIALERQRRDVAEKRRRIPSHQTEPVRDGGPRYDREYDGLLDELDVMRRRAGISISHFKYQKPTRVIRGGAVPATIDKREFELTCRGRFYGLLRLLNLLETDARQINVDEFTISGGTTLKMKIHSFALKRAPTKPPPARAKPAPRKKPKKPADAVEIRTTEFP